MTQASLTTLPPFYERYIRLVEEIDVLEGLAKYSPSILFSEKEMEAIGDRVYTEGKWTARQLLQHCIDTERIMAYRALRFARQDATPLPSFEENDYAAAADVSHRTIADLMEEFTAVRGTSIQLFRHFTNADLLRSGQASGIEIHVLHLGYVLIGHPMHHAHIWNKRYRPLLG